MHSKLGDPNYVCKTYTIHLKLSSACDCDFALNDATITAVHNTTLSHSLCSIALLIVTV